MSNEQQESEPEFLLTTNNDPQLTPLKAESSSSSGECSADYRIDGSSAIHNELVQNEEFIPMDLHTAASIGDIYTVKELITRGIDVNEVNCGGWSGLHYAAYIGHNSICKLLLDSGASVEQKNEKGRTALMLAASCGNDTTVKLLLEMEANLNEKDGHWSALFYATNSNHSNVTKVLVGAGSDMNESCCDQHEVTPLHIAAGDGHEIIVQIFLQYGGDVEKKCKTGAGARQLAELNGRHKVLDLILRHRSTSSGGSGSNQSIPHRPLTTYPIISSKIGGKNHNQLLQHSNPHKLQPPSNNNNNNHSQQLAASNNMEKTLTPTQKQFPLSERNEKIESLEGLLKEIGVEKYYATLEKQGIDLQSFLGLSDNELKEAGIKSLGPRKKMSSAIERWHAKGPQKIEDPQLQAYTDYLQARFHDANKKALLASESLSKLDEELEIVNEKNAQLQNEIKVLRSQTREWTVGLKRIVDDSSNKSANKGEDTVNLFNQIQSLYRLVCNY